METGDFTEKPSGQTPKTSARGGESGSGSKVLTTLEAEEHAFNAIKGSDNSDIVVLGRYDTIKGVDGKDLLDAKGNRIPSDKSYNVIAKDMGAQYFELDNWDELASTYFKEDMWKINERFLDIQTSSGREIYLVNDPKDFVKGDSAFAKEVNYLINNGYHFIDEGGIWHAVR